MARNSEVTNGEAPTGMTVDAVRDVAMKALLDVAADKQSPAAARAGASRTLLTDTARWRECSQAGIQASESTFSRAAHTAAVVSVYERAAERTSV